MNQAVRVMQKPSGKRMDGIKAPSFDGTQLCAQVDPELFFPNTAGEANRVKKIVKKLCSSCEFQTLCLEYALDNDVLGIWGGMLDSERMRIKSQRRKLSA